jgi:hypothetical protein
VYDLKVMLSGGYFLLLKDEAHVDESKCCLGLIDDGNNVFKHLISHLLFCKWIWERSRNQNKNYPTLE